MKGERDILHEIKRRKGNWIGHILLWNCFLIRDIVGNIEGRIEGRRIRGRRRKQLLGELKEKDRVL